ncbi:DNA polymerase delta subunit 4 [Aplochiton taeniatus]
MTAKNGLITDSFQVVKKTQAEPAPLTVREKELQTLEQFDLDWRFGPCTGIGRLQRWERAAVHGLNPPKEIKELLLRAGADPEYTQCLWRDYPL